MQVIFKEDNKMTKVQSIRKKLLAALLIIAVAIAFSPLTATTAHAVANDAYEPNDAISAAKAIALNTTISANLAPNSNNGGYGSSAYDYYAFTVSQAGPYTVEFSHAVPSGATHSSFAYVRVETQAEARKGSGYSYLDVGKTYITTDWLNAGTYYVSIEAFSSDAGFDQPYSFAVKRGGYIDSAYYYVRHSYTGKNISPVTSVYSQSTRLTLNKDYKVSGIRKGVGLGKATLTGIGNYYGTHTVDFGVYPNWVMLKSVKALGKKKVKVTWYKTSSVDKYVVQYKLSSSKTWKSKTVSKSKSSVTLSKLKKGKRYNIRIYAYKSSGGKRFNSINTDSNITTAYTKVPGFATYSKKNVKVK
jgi:hypothetical protein